MITTDENRHLSPRPRRQLLKAATVASAATLAAAGLLSATGLAQGIGCARSDGVLCIFDAGAPAVAVDVNHNFAVVDSTTQTLRNELTAARAEAAQLQAALDMLQARIEAKVGALDASYVRVGSSIQFGTAANESLSFRNRSGAGVASLASDGALQAKSVNGHTLSGVGLACRGISARRQNPGDDATVTANCAANEVVTGCSCYGPWNNCDGSYISSARACVSQSGGGGLWFEARAICCRVN